MRKVLITGISSGLGAALAEECLRRGDDVYALGRHDNKALYNRPGYYFFPVDISDVEMLRENIKTFVARHHFDLVILNAGVMGDLKELSETSLQELRRVMDLNLWANKQIIDTVDLHAKAKQIVAVSSGAAVNGNKGWGGYAISKAALNIMIKIYAAEKPWIHFSAIAPGVIMTPMLQRIFETADPALFPSVQRIRDGLILSPEDGARRFLKACDLALKEESGSYLDVRKMGL
ncbi:SDR family NAD(P)-dependent oxidoreductase [Nitratifractor sp.]